MFKDGKKSKTALLARLLVVLVSLALLGGYIIPAQYVFASNDQEDQLTIQPDDHEEYPVTQPNKYTVTYDANGGEGDAPVDHGVYGQGAKANTRIKDGSELEKEDMIFVGWTVEGDENVYYDGMKYEVKGNTVFFALYGDPADYVILTQEANDTSGDTHNWYVKKDEEPVLGGEDLFMNGSKVFVGWSEDPEAAPGDEGVYAADSLFKKMYWNETVYAIWKTLRWKVTFTAEIGGGFKDEAGTVFGRIKDGTAFAEAVTVPEPIAAEGYYFTGWDKKFPKTIKKNYTFVAQFAEIAPPASETEEEEITTITIKAGDAEKVYDGIPLTEEMYAITEGKLKAGDTIEVSMTEESVINKVGTEKNVIGEYAITREGEDVTDEYAVATEEGILTVTPTPMLLAVGNIEIMHGAPIPTNFKVSADGLVNNEKEVDVLKGLSLNCKTDYTPDAPAGSTFFIKLEVSGLSEGDIHGNYIITANSGLLNVTGPYGMAIGDDETPLGWFNKLWEGLVPLSSFSVWALLNLILTIVTGLIMAVPFIVQYRKRRAMKMEGQDEYEDRLDQSGNSKKRLWFRLATIVTALAAIALFAMTSDTSLPMVMTDSWTGGHIAIAAATLALAVLAREKREDKEELGIESV